MFSTNTAMPRGLMPGSDEASQLRLAIEASPTGMLIVDDQGHIVLVNAQIEKLFGYERQALLGKPVEMLVPERFRAQHPAVRQAFLREHRTRPMGAGHDLFGLRYDGSEIPIEIGLNPLHTSDGKFILSSVVDITERKRAERILREKTVELERSNRELEQFAYVASHDLREPLRTVATYLTLLEREYRDRLGPDANNYIHFAVSGAQRMTRLVSDLLAYARIGARRAASVEVNCQELVQQVLIGLCPSVDETQAIVTIAELPSAFADPLQLGQVFQNLLENALKFYRERPVHVTLEAQRGETETVFRVIDDGIGIEPRFHARVFELFQRLHGPDRYPGTGMGLALCQKIIERHGGRIWIESELGVGSTFSFSLPRVPLAPTAAP